MSELSNLWLFALAIAKAAAMTGLAPALLLAVAIEQRTYVYRWARYLGMPVLGGTRKGLRCKVLVRGKRNSCLIEFPDGFQAVTSRNALRRGSLMRWYDWLVVIAVYSLIPSCWIGPAEDMASSIDQFLATGQPQTLIGKGKKP